jgi:3-dehydroquinate dehydratase-2
MQKIMLLNGPNLNMLGVRQPQIYGRETLADIEKRVRKLATAHKVGLDFRQSNHEGELVTWIQEARKTADGIVINPGAYTHTSLAILDALMIFEKPIIELHLSNPHKREEYRHFSYASQVATATIAGLGAYGYEAAFAAMVHLLKTGKGKKK